ncbi:hypothetical protein ANO11243_091320 [Dothideomycetidae sp. 11243]|nr:hypothetical protein ANO11243_091320 [fungal sp. No.11243]
MANWVWQAFPLTISVIQRLLARTVAPDTVNVDRLTNPLRDLPAIFWQVGLASAFSSAVWIFTLLKHGMVDTFIPSALTIPQDFINGIFRLLQWDWVLTFGACYVWLAYSFWDLKSAGMAGLSWAALCAIPLACTAAIGPGATFAVGWSYREYCLAYRKHKHAVVGRDQLQSNTEANGSTVKVTCEQ